MKADRQHAADNRQRAQGGAQQGLISLSPEENALPEALREKLAQVERSVRAMGPVIVALSAGVDSTLLAAIARRVLGRDGVLAVTANSPSLASADLEEARRLAAMLDLEHRVIETAEVEDPAYRVNAPSRCYFCKLELFTQLRRLAEARGIRSVLYGAIGDDRLDERPGAVAATETGARAPLQEAGLSKSQVRELARWLGLANWNRPQNACLSSRIPHGLEVTETKLRQVEQAEAFLAVMGFRQIRVRHLGTHARIEVGADEVARFQDTQLAQHLAQRFAQLGFHSVGIDRHGYRPGGADRTQPDELLLQTSLAV